MDEDASYSKYIRLAAVLCIIIVVVVTMGYYGLKGTENNTSGEAQKISTPIPTQPSVQTIAITQTQTPTQEPTQCKTCGSNSGQDTPIPSSLATTAIPTDAVGTTTTTYPTIIPTFVPTVFTPSPTPAPTPEYYVNPAYDTPPTVGLLFNMDGNTMWIMKENEDGTYDVTNHNEYIELMKSLKDDIEQQKDVININIPIQKMTREEIINYIHS
ncbi:MAG: hypothetical protein AMQ22_00580 [Candidatus Methanofastidiosum methylothiophilum]|uniref:Uncharacterized protein n=1 Tax=Candidatus Methanofastidiosum methylothiophilum TaxID=1705564 RepID=A0A150J6A6_9EURY|nr:MAG: hypothetical protein AMQ22_00580 [Candidatus Methanofastidiosum methylthiophilus]